MIFRPCRFSGVAAKRDDALWQNEQTGMAQLLSRHIHAVTQFLARLEVRDELLRHLPPFTRFRISAHPSRPVIEPEAAEPPDLDALPAAGR